MVRRTLIAATTAVAAVAAVAWSTGGAGAAADTEAFHIVSDSSDGMMSSTFTAHGVFSDSGTDTSKSMEDNLRSSVGAITLYHPDTDGSYRFKYNKNTCVARVTVDGSYTIGNGKRAYKGISGSGTYHGSGVDQLARNEDGSCSFSMEPVSSHFEVHASGPVSFASAS